MPFDLSNEDAHDLLDALEFAIAMNRSRGLHDPVVELRRQHWKAIVDRLITLPAFLPREVVDVTH